jgi:hypothetical protein
MILVSYPAGFDPYGKDASKATSGIEMLFRLFSDEKGVYRVVCLSKKEAEDYRAEHAPRAKKRKAGR